MNIRVKGLPVLSSWEVQIRGSFCDVPSVHLSSKPGQLLQLHNQSLFTMTKLKRNAKWFRIYDEYKILSHILNISSACPVYIFGLVFTICVYSSAAPSPCSSTWSIIVPILCAMDCFCPPPRSIRCRLVTAITNTWKYLISIKYEIINFTFKN